MAVVLITGSAGLIGSEAARFFASKGLEVVGLDNDMRRYFFGPEASTAPVRRTLEATISGYTHRESTSATAKRSSQYFADTAMTSPRWSIPPPNRRMTGRRRSHSQTSRSMPWAR